MDRKLCDSTFAVNWKNMVWVPVANLIFSSISLILTLNYINDIVTVYKQMRRKYQPTTT